MNQYTYIGSELDLFAKSVRWKDYWRNQLSQYLRGSILEVGAGNGNNTGLLLDLKIAFDRWVCLEPDAGLCGRIHADQRIAHRTEVIQGTLADIPDQETFDSILYVDVLEHIEQDALELLRAEQHLKAGGHLLVLSPAHQWLYAPFDKAIGHFRRYSKRSLRAVAPPDLTLVSLRYLDCAGLFASLGNRFILKSAMPNEKQLAFWDSYLVPVSRRLDMLFDYQIGKSILGIWRKAR